MGQLLHPNQRAPHENWPCPRCGELATAFKQAFERYLTACSDLGASEARGEHVSMRQLRRPIEAQREALRMETDFRMHSREAHPPPSAPRSKNEKQIRRSIPDKRAGTGASAGSL